MDEVEKKVKELLIDGDFSEAVKVLMDAGRVEEALALERYPEAANIYLGKEGVTELIRRRWEKGSSLSEIVIAVRDLHIASEWGKYYTLCYVVD